MRIIGGRLKGLRLNPPGKLPVRPTTDSAKEALFNILYNQFDFESLKVLDLFSGTGNISLEFASRGVPSITSVDRDFGCYNYLKSVAKQYSLDSVKPVKADVLKYLEVETDQYDLIFVDPPYDLPQMNQIAPIVFRRNILKADGVLIVEHHSMKKIDNDPHFKEQRKYGSSSFSFFTHQ
ncbi:RsmD family RNA methyltransferase [Daejeonella lutea]|uniref:16S rRNA (Guanine(966)-N(2))-methyltransferase RsmD n=1 Tax=Daejeonella lutea TaxID=572036 RepID=A0A1T5F554_9SPHI|nr:RsmD family RNA methyltransferase [Daejeonella lutea]SKB91303.1 16S rRNA (guanine(966)-N(2))-methyltransferase RsmD [Daejeonella lutea]